MALVSARPLHTGETFTLTLTAVNPLPQALTGWTVPVRYDTLKLQLVNVTGSALWRAPLTISTNVVGNNMLCTITATGQAGGQAVEAYRTSSSIQLAVLHFAVHTAVPGTYPGVIAVAAGTVLSPSWLSPQAVFYDHRGGPQLSGSINVAPTSTVGLWVWADSGDVFNTAPLSGQRVTTQLNAAYVRSWGTPAAVPAAPTCTVSGSADTISGVATLDSTKCVVNVDAVNTAAAKHLAFTLGYGGIFATAVISVWQPSRVVVQAEDPVLNSVLPLNAAPPSAGCTDSYQSSRLRAWVDWSNGGDAATDALASSDITALVSFASNDSSVALVFGATVKGISPGKASVGLARPIAGLQNAVITVSSTPTCVVSLQPLATTGITFNGPALAPAPDGTAALSWSAAQDLTWENVTARVLTYAQFSDGTSMDISEHAALGLVVPAGAAAGALPFGLSVDAAGWPTVTVNASVSGDGAVSSCGAYLTAAWQVCSRPLGSGQGQLVLALPSPLAIANVSAEPLAVSSATDPAALPPISEPMGSALSVAIVFSDGSLRDFSADNRTVFAVTQGASMCTVSRGSTDGAWQLQALPGISVAVGDSCTVTVRVAFAGSAAPLTGSVAVDIVALRTVLLYALPPATLALSPLPLATAPVGGSLRLLRCDARNFDQYTMWVLAALTNCSAPPSSCPLIDINSQQWISLGSSDTSVFDVMHGYPSDPGDEVDDACCPLFYTLIHAECYPVGHLHSLTSPLLSAFCTRLCHLPSAGQPPGAISTRQCRSGPGLGQLHVHCFSQCAGHIPAHLAPCRERNRHHPPDLCQHDGRLLCGVPGCTWINIGSCRESTHCCICGSQWGHHPGVGHNTGPQLLRSYCHWPDPRHQLHGAHGSAQWADAVQWRHSLDGCPCARHPRTVLHKGAPAARVIQPPGWQLHYPVGAGLGRTWVSQRGGLSKP